MSDATNVRNGGMGRRVSEVGDLINAMAIVPPEAEVDFVGRLAAEEQWPIARARRAYDEYRRFLLLAWISPVMVVPSHDVDQAWHLHLTHSRHYWDVLCGTILQKPFHHEPSLGGRSEESRHGNAYRTTLALYRHVFGEEAPLDAWPRGCGCADATREAGPVRETVLASSPYVGVVVLGAVPTLIALATGHPWIAMCFVGIAIALAVIVAAAENEERERERIRLSRQSRVAGVARDPEHLSQSSYASHSAGWKDGGSSNRPSSSSGRRADASASGKGGSMDSSGQDTGFAFMAMLASDDASASSNSGHGSHGQADGGSTHSSSSTHSSHSCSTSSGSHSCGGSGSSCGSSCGGGGCGGS